MFITIAGLERGSPPNEERGKADRISAAGETLGLFRAVMTTAKKKRVTLRHKLLKGPGGPLIVYNYSGTQTQFAAERGARKSGSSIYKQLLKTASSSSKYRRISRFISTGSSVGAGLLGISAPHLTDVITSLYSVITDSFGTQLQGTQ